MPDDNRELIEQFNKDEQRYRRLERKKQRRRARFPKLSEKFHKLLDRLDEAIERRRPVDCISKTWIR